MVPQNRRVTLGAKGAKMCTQAPAPGLGRRRRLGTQCVCRHRRLGTHCVCRRRRLGTHYVPRRQRLGTHFGSFCTECYPSVKVYWLYSMILYTVCTIQRVHQNCIALNICLTYHSSIVHLSRVNQNCIAQCNTVLVCSLQVYY